MTKSGKSRFDATVDEEILFMNIGRKNMDYVLRVFEDFSLLSVRKKCLERMAIFGSNFWVEWAESCIRCLLKQNDGSGILEEVISWYVFASDTGIAERAIFFTLNLTRDGESPFRLFSRQISKPITSRLQKEDGVRIYFSIPCARNFLEELLGEPGESRYRGYDLAHWVEVERALRTIVAVKDVYFLPKLFKIADGYHRGEIFPDYKADLRFPYYAKAAHIAAVWEALKILQKVPESQFSV